VYVPSVLASPHDIVVDVAALVRGLEEGAEADAGRSGTHAADSGGDGDLSLDGGADGDLSFAGNPQLSIPPPISSGGGGGIEATWQVLYMTGWSHGDGQQQAAQRGSAGVSLSQLEEELEKLPEPDKA